MYLHGDLQLNIMQAQNLPSGGFHRSASGSFDDHLLSVSDKRRSQGMYVTVYIAGARIARTQFVSSSQNPIWNQGFKIPLAHPDSEMELRLKDKNFFFKPKIIGYAKVAVEIVRTRELIEEWFPVTGAHAKPESAIKLQMSFIPCQTNPIYERGISEDYQVRESYFPVRHGGKLSLYQDAHVMDDGTLPEIKLDEGIKYEHQKCWEDICRAITEAQHLVYIVGWSVNHKVKLIREPRPLPKKGNLSLGELLKAKSMEGVKVVVLVWNDITSYTPFFGKGGVMKTHDKETQSFFKNSVVSCCLAPQFTFANFMEQARRVLFTQHQKCVIVDTQGRDGNKRKLTAFIGGLDLCEGRYDTPEHRLFRDLNTVFKNDYHNPTLDHTKVKGPRQPWHDLHCKIEGAAAYDVLKNFEQRWLKNSTELSKTGSRPLFKARVCSWKDDDVIDFKDDIPNLPNLDLPSTLVSDKNDPEIWHIQVFRSIDSGSLKGFPKDADAIYEQNLECDKREVRDRSIERAYIQAIRSAQRFIYIENQYFIGSSYAWPGHKDNEGVTNLIPMELALKIVNKIRAKERFCVYIVIPMWPEGDPTSFLNQEIIYWQRQTMRMMYEVVARELNSSELVNARPTDYLNFYCLGNREQPVSTSPTSIEHGIFPARWTRGLKSSRANKIPDSDSQKFGRFMIYVHSKGMIVDDEYVILGSANINERSMAGSRDTEIVMGAYQPHYITSKSPRGQVYGYRMSLWAEHIGSVEKCFEAPESMDCVAYVNSVAEDNWRRYTADEFRPLQGHILKYPIQVDINGNVEDLPGFETFPDVGGLVQGSATQFLSEVKTRLVQ